MGADIFAVGVILYTIVIGDYPWERTIPSDTHYKDFDDNNPKFWERNRATPEFKDLFQGMCARDPRKRPTLDQIRNHKFLLGNKGKLMKDWEGQQK